MAPPTDDEVLAAEYLRFQATITGTALKDAPAGVEVKDTVVDWNVAHPTHPRGPNGRFIRAGGGLPSAPTVPHADGLDTIGDNDLRDLAIEHGVSVWPVRPRAEVIADLRTVGAAAPPPDTRATQAAPTPPTPPFAIRPELARLRTRAEVETYTAEHVSLNMGRLVPVRMGNRLPLDTMRELSEGLLRSSERWPNANLVRVDVVGGRGLRGAAPDAWSTTYASHQGVQIAFNQAQLANRQHFLRQLQRTIDAGDHRPTAASNGAAYVAAHEFGRVVEASLPQPSQHNSPRMRAALEHVQSAGVDLNDSSAVNEYIRRQLGDYATHRTPALVAEAFADVELNGEDGASPLSVAIVRQMRIDHDALPATAPDAGGRHRAPSTPAQPVGPGAPSTPRPPAPAGQERHIGNLIPLTRDEADARRAELRQIFKAQLDGDYAGLTLRVQQVNASTNSIEFNAQMYDARGNIVGTTSRRFRRHPDGKLSAYHALMTVNRNHQGQGFAEAWNGRLMRWYSESGVDRVTVHANIDVGGYTWARQGFDFEAASDARPIADRLRSLMQLPAASSRFDAAQRAAVADLLSRMDTRRFGSPTYPTAYEVSQVGRLPGHTGRDDMWPGKIAMLNSSWHGVKPVPPPPASTS